MLLEVFKTMISTCEPHNLEGFATASLQRSCELHAQIIRISTNHIDNNHARHSRQICHLIYFNRINVHVAEPPNLMSSQEYLSSIRH
jgi:hypothetical protein